MKKYKLKRKYKIMIIIILAIIGLNTIKNNNKNWYQECDNHYGYTTDYYTCRQYHLSK